MTVRVCPFFGDLVVEGVETVDRRYVPPGETRWRHPPLPVLGVDGAEPVGQIAHVWRHDKTVCCTGTLTIPLWTRFAIRRERFVLAAELLFPVEAPEVGVRSIEEVVRLGQPEICAATLGPAVRAPWPGQRLWIVR